ncbi:beta-1,3-galactosyltransferase brn-like isoform X1 [Epargyreus clarus]|uniref:beta-1,3-galactosyltransferase brn-like isoform X1 n=1 Tax=Epargyreus clarus TaxID=520877 RepID=UPI003C2FE702
MRRKRFLVYSCAVVFVYYFFGIGDYVFSKSYENDFSYPLNVNLKSVVDDVLSGDRPNVAPINYYPYKYLSNSQKCSTYERIDLVILVKSALEHVAQRRTIRLTYGRENDAPANRIVKILFFLGVHKNPDPSVVSAVEMEKKQYSDIIQMDFQDNYYNMTIKTMMTFRWAYEHCSRADYYLFTDDDMYISVKNLLNYVETAIADVAHDKAYENHLFAGYVFKSSPQRFWTSKWRVSLEEYPWDRWPPYVTAGAYVLSNKSMKTIHVASAFVKHFRFDDIYLGIIAKKLGLELTHCENFHFYKKMYTREGYKDVIASHGYGNPSEMFAVWHDYNKFNKT